MNHYASFILLDTDSDPNPGIDIPKIGTVAIGRCESRYGSKSETVQVNMFCIVQCSHRVWNLNSNYYRNPYPAM